jgi:pullulanase/glycogen debranching enzyme
VHRTDKTFRKGTHSPLGATVTPDGVNFAVYSQQATDVFLLLFDEPDADPTDVIQLMNRDRFVSHALVRGIRPGQLYGYKARGEYRPESGLRFNEAKLLLDPYAKAIQSLVDHSQELERTVKALNEKLANDIFNILVETCGAHESWRGHFIHIETTGCEEYRFQGDLGFGGKFRNNLFAFATKIEPLQE